MDSLLGDAMYITQDQKGPRQLKNVLSYGDLVFAGYRRVEFVGLHFGRVEVFWASF